MTEQPNECLRPNVVATIRRWTENALSQTNDRCDRCGAQAFIKVALPSGFDLLFCVHHFGDAHDKIVATEGAVIDDYSGALEREAAEARSKLGI